MHLILLVVAVLLIGFALGRVKNKAKLAAVHAELSKAEASTSAEVKKLAEDVKKKL
jgi:hypothetical protein